MRKLLWFMVGFAAACAAGVYLLSGIWFGLFGLFCLIGCIGLLCLQTKPGKIIAVILLGCVVGFGWLWGYDSVYLSAARACDGESLPLTVTASDYSYATGYGQTFDGYTEIDSKTYQVRCYVNDTVPIVPGNVMQGEFSLRYTADGGQREPTYHQGKGIFLLAYQHDEINVSDGKLRIWDYPSIWRQKILTAIEASFPVDTAGFAKALLLGESSDFTYKQDRDFQVSGIRHIIAVSGLHVSILFALIYLVFGHQRVLNAVFGIPLLLVFAAVAGFSPSIIRACVMQILMLLALLTDREYDPPTALSFAVLVILGVNPRAITSVSFQLSVGCMIGIFTFYEPLQKYFLSLGKLKKLSMGKSRKAKLIRWFTGSVTVSLSAMVVTTPLCALYFGMISLVGILTNLLTLWIISFIFYGIMLVCAASAIWLPMARIIAWVISWPIRYVLTVSGLIADFPLAAVYTDSIYIVYWLLLTYIFLSVFFLRKKKEPGITAAGIVVLLCICIALSWVEPLLDDTRVSVIDVGQGQSILIKQGSEHYLVDCGGEDAGITADIVTNFLLSQGIFRLDGIILTHYDADHAGSVLNLLTCVDADKIYMPDLYDSNNLRQLIEDAYPDKIRLVKDIFEINVDGGNFTLYPTESVANDNESSVCVLFQSENCDILITGDRSKAGERALLEQAALPKLALLVVGHHGSNEATSFELLLSTRPEAAVISVGEGNLYGHPRAEVLERLAYFDCEIYRTDQQGTITFRR